MMDAFLFCSVDVVTSSGVATGGAGGGGRGGGNPPWLWKMENSEICHLGENDTQLTTVRFWILTTSYVDMYGSVIGPCLKKIFFIFPTFFSIKLTLISIKSTLISIKSPFSPLFNFCVPTFFSR